MLPSRVLDVPTGHGKHADAPALGINVPGKQGIPSVDPERSVNVPGIVGKQKLITGARVVFENVPGGQSKHAPDPVGA